LAHVSPKMRIATRFVLALLILGPLLGLGQIEPRGVLIYRQPATTYTETLEYRSFRQDNALYATLITSSGEPKQLKSEGVLAVVSYPPASFDEYFATTAQTAIAKIEALKPQYPAVRPQLEQAQGKWTRALGVFHQLETKSATKTESNQPPVLSLQSGVFKNARITSATPERVTLAHASGVMTLPIVELTAAQVLALNRNSDKVQLPLGIARPASRSIGQRPIGQNGEEGALTQRIAAAGNAAVTSCATKMGISSAAFSAWTFFVVLPGVVLLLLLGLVFLARQSAPRLTRPGSK
jgi:hypothetical protein